MTDEDPQQNASEDPAMTHQLDRPDAKLHRSLKDFKNDIQDRVRDLLRAKKASEQLCRSGALENLELVQKYADWLQEADLSAIGMNDRRETAVESLEQFVKKRRRRRRMEFMQELHRLADEEDLELEKLSESPLTFFLDPFTVEANFDSGDVRLQYAREDVAEVDLEPAAVLEARDEALDSIGERAVSSEQFFDRLQMAYRLAIASAEKSEGERVDLVDLLAPLALLSSETETWRRPEFDGMISYPRFILAFQLQQLRRDGVLSREGLRLDLGTATGGSTKDKDDVIFIPSGRGEGQYYLSIRFTDEDHE